MTEATENKTVKLRSGLSVDITATEHCGTLGSILHQKPNGFIICKISGVTCVGMLHEIAVGAQYKLEGTFEENKKYNDWQFKFKKYECKIDASAGLREYLIREAPGLGPALATRLVTEYKDKAMEILRKESERLLLPPFRMQQSRVDAIKTWANGEYSNSKIKERLYAIGITPSQVAKLIAHYGNNAEEKIKQDCFQLVEIRGFGFVTVSVIADLVGVPKNDPGRIKAAILYALDKILEEGHTCTTGLDLLREASALVNLKHDIVSPYLERMIEADELVTSKTDFKKYCEEQGIIYAI